MKNLLLILAGAFAVFMALAIVQEWEMFGAAWFGGGEEAPPPLAESERKAAADAVYMALSLMQHFYGSGGDPRYAERMPYAIPALALFIVAALAVSWWTMRRVEVAK